MDIESKALEVTGQLRWTVNVARDDMIGWNARPTQCLLSHSTGDLVEISAHEGEWILVQDPTPFRPFSYYGIEVLQEGSVAATHVADAVGLAVERAVENLHNDLVYLLEVGFVRAT